MASAQHSGGGGDGVSADCVSRATGGGVEGRVPSGTATNNGGFATVVTPSDSHICVNPWHASDWISETPRGAVGLRFEGDFAAQHGDASTRRGELVAQHDGVEQHGSAARHCCRGSGACSAPADATPLRQAATDKPRDSASSSAASGGRTPSRRAQSSRCSGVWQQQLAQQRAAVPQPHGQFSQGNRSAPAAGSSDGPGERGAGITTPEESSANQHATSAIAAARSRRRVSDPRVIGQSMRLRQACRNAADRRVGSTPRRVSNDGWPPGE
jgi:hypothetical protein